MDANAAVMKPDTVKLLLDLADKQLLCEEYLAKAEEMVKMAKANLEDIQLYKIPELMLEAGINSVDTPTHLITVTDELKASIAKKNKPLAHAWLRENGHGDIIKNQVTVRIPAGSDEAADKLLCLAQELELDAERDESVHSSTLKAFCKEMQAQGEDLNEDLLGVFNFRKSKIKKV